MFDRSQNFELSLHLASCATHFNVVSCVFSDKPVDVDGDMAAADMDTPMPGDRPPLHQQLMPPMIQPVTSMPAGMQGVVPTHMMPGKVM